MAGQLDEQTAAFLKWLEDPAAPPLNMQTPDEFRALIRDLIQEIGGDAEPVSSVEDSTIPGPAGEIPARIYTPEGEGPFPILVFYHGGGWVIGDLDTLDTVIRPLTNLVRCVTVSVDYRLAPENVFPAAVDDAFAAVRWVHQNAAGLNGDPGRIAVGGDSAGGNLSAVVSQLARDHGGPPIVHQLLIYPVTDLSSVDTDSYLKFADGYLLTREMMEWYIDLYVPNKSDRKDPRASPLLADSLEGLPPAHVFTAEFDPLLDEGKAYADALQEAGVPVKYSEYRGTIHGFFILRAVVDRSHEGIAEAAGALKEAFESS